MPAVKRRAKRKRALGRIGAKAPRALVVTVSKVREPWRAKGVHKRAIARRAAAKKKASAAKKPTKRARTTRFGALRRR